MIWINGPDALCFFCECRREATCRNAIGLEEKARIGNLDEEGGSGPGQGVLDLNILGQINWNRI